jgi:hypothetical protein
MPIIVLEGPDMAGKTTLARQLADTYQNSEIKRQGPPSGDILETYLRPIEEWASSLRTNESEHLILDRWHMGELVYGPLLRGESLLTERQADYIDMVLQTFGCTFVHLTAPLNVLKDRYDIRGDNLIKKDQLKFISADYELLLRNRSHWATFSVMNGTQIHIRTCAASSMAGRYIGPRKPKVLLLGDMRASERFIFPFVPARATSGHWLMGAMREVGVNHMDVGLLNACELRSNVLYAQWVELGRPPVITLGRNAEKAWRIARAYERVQESSWDENTHYLHHPQYMRRFHYLQFAEYGEKIKWVIDVV